MNDIARPIQRPLPLEEHHVESSEQPMLDTSIVIQEEVVEQCVVKKPAGELHKAVVQRKPCPMVKSVTSLGNLLADFDLLFGKVPSVGPTAAASKALRIWRTYKDGGPQAKVLVVPVPEDSTIRVAPTAAVLRARSTSIFCEEQPVTSVAPVPVEDQPPRKSPQQRQTRNEADVKSGNNSMCTPTFGSGTHDNGSQDAVDMDELDLVESVNLAPTAIVDHDFRENSRCFSFKYSGVWDVKKQVDVHKNALLPIIDRRDSAPSEEGETFTVSGDEEAFPCPLCGCDKLLQPLCRTTGRRHYVS